jgi:hypothetical protein
MIRLRVCVIAALGSFASFVATPLSALASLAEGQHPRPTPGEPVTFGQ